MENTIAAGIDIGTNTILMTIGRLSPSGGLTVLRDEHSIARLGENVDRTNLIGPEAVERARKILENYKRICDGMKTQKIEIAGTSALRDAANSREVCRELSSAIGAEINVVSGEEEARLSFLGTIETDGPAIALDVGGGSTEIIFGDGRTVRERRSLNIGAVRITERFFNAHPPKSESVKRAVNEIQKALEAIHWSDGAARLYAVAGTPTTLAAAALGLKDFERDAIHGYILDIEKIDELIDMLMRMTIAKIIEKFHIHPMRADLITAGSLILRESMKRLKQNKCFVSVRGLRYGVLSEALIKK